MGIHVSCDFCYKSIEKDYVELHLVPQARLFDKIVFVSCRDCIRNKEYLHLSAKNPNYIAPPPEETTDGAQS